MKKEERNFSKIVCDYFIYKLKENNFEKLTVLEKVPILRDITTKIVANQWGMVFGFQEQDVVITFKNWERLLPAPKRPVKCVNLKSYKSVIIPIIICELKITKNFNTHSLILYNSMASDIKQIFPYNKYFFILSDKSRNVSFETIMRHSKRIDNFFQGWEESKENIWKGIELNLSNLKGNLFRKTYLYPDSFFQTNKKEWF